MLKLRTNWQSLKILPKEYILIMDKIIEFMEKNTDEMHGFKDYEVLKMKRDRDWMSTGTDNLERKQGDFYKFFKEHDKRRSTNFLKTFPEMQEFWYKCEHYAKQH